MAHSKIDDYNFVTPPHRSFLCAICHDVITDAKLTPCGHVFCMRCLDGWTVTIDGDVATCPECREDIRKSEIVRDRNVDRQVQQFEVYCANRYSGCMDTPEICDYEAHVRNCLYNRVECPMKCGTRVLVCEKDKHESSACLLRKVTCEGCGVEGSARWRMEHERECQPVPELEEEQYYDVSNSEADQQVTTDTTEAQKDDDNPKKSCGVEIPWYSISAAKFKSAMTAAKQKIKDVVMPSPAEGQVIPAGQGVPLQVGQVGMVPPPPPPPWRIHILVNPNYKIPLICGPNEEIRSVKSMVQNAERIPVFQQTLIYMGVELEDGQTLYDYNVQKECTVRLHVIPKDTFQIFVRSFKNGRTFTLNGVRGTDTVEVIMARVKDREGVKEEEQRLIYQGRQLVPGHELSEYNIEKDSTLHHVLRLNGGVG